MFGSNQNLNLSTAQRLHKIRGKAPAGKKFVSSSVYMPAGPTCNVKPTKIKNPKIAAHVQMMHERWWAAKQARQAAKAQPCA